MAKINPQKTIQKRRTKYEMTKALEAFVRGAPQTSEPPQDDDTAIILNDCIEELLESRQIIEEIRGFVQTWGARFARKV